MKKSWVGVLLLILLAFSFWDRSWYDNRKGAKADPSGEKSAVADLEGSPDTASDIGTSSLPPGTVRISREKQRLIGVQTGVVEERAAEKTLRLLGTVAPDENRLFKVKAAVDGIIREVYLGTTGSMVKKGQRLASFYSPDIYTAEQGYLVSQSSERYRKFQYVQVQVTESNLKFLGMAASQIAELGKTGEIIENIVLEAPETGFVLAREASPEFRFQKGEELYRIASLDRVWIYADVYESDARYVRSGVMARVSHPQLDQKMEAPVSEVLPLFDATARTLKVRLEVDNPGFLLRPDMFVDIELPVKLPPAITIPADAVLDSGLRKTVFVDHGNGLFEPREIETGWRFDDRVEVKKGLKPGEKIAVSGNFLIDSESKLELAAWGMHTGLSKDPVNSLDVSERKAAREGRTFVYKGKTYYFSSDGSKTQFEKEPEKYLEEYEGIQEPGVRIQEPGVRIQEGGAGN